MEKLEIVEYFEGNEIHFGKKTEESDNRIVVEKASKQKLKLTSSRILFQHQVLSQDNLSSAISDLDHLIESEKR